MLEKKRTSSNANPTGAKAGAHTITDVAARAGVSIKTVSRVLNREAGVRSDTEKRVQRAMRELNYRPNFSARNLASARAFLFVLLYDDSYDNYLDYYLLNIQAGLLKACEAARYGLLLQPCSIGDARLIETVLSLITARRPSGLILTPPLCDHAELLDALDSEGIDYVCIAPFHERDSRPCVSMDDQQAGSELTELLINSGHQRIAFIKGLGTHGAASRRFDGYLHALNKHGIAADPQLIANGAFTFDSGLECARRLLLLPDRPTAVFAANDGMAAGVLYAAHLMKIEVPQQLSVAGFDDTPLARFVYPALTTVRQPVRAMAEGAAECLLNAIDVRDGLPVEPNWVRRFSFEIVVRDSIARRS